MNPEHDLEAEYDQFVAGLAVGDIYITLTNFTKIYEMGYQAGKQIGMARTP